MAKGEYKTVFQVYMFFSSVKGSELPLTHTSPHLTVRKQTTVDKVANKGNTNPNMKKKISADMYYCNREAGFSKKGAQ